MDSPLAGLACQNDGHLWHARVRQDAPRSYLAGKICCPLSTAQDIALLMPHEAVKDAIAFVLDDAADTLEKEDWLFHFYNLVKEKDAFCLFCSAQAPTQWGVQLPDLRSRLSTLLSVSVTPPDEDALRAVLFKLFTEKGMTLSSQTHPT